MIAILTGLILCASLKCGITHAENRQKLADIILPDLLYDNDENIVPDATKMKESLSPINPVLDSELQKLSNILVNVLEQSWGPEGVPIIYVEESPNNSEEETNNGIISGNSPDYKERDMEARIPGLTGRNWKRSRYYRRYPWKRQNSRSRTRYEVDNRYMCQPSREDVFKLLVALHETRAGNGGRSINFCNRRRSAGAIFTNIRFLGRK